jgi:hypothetical protein
MKVTGVTETLDLALIGSRIEKFVCISTAGECTTKEGSGGKGVRTKYTVLFSPAHQRLQRHVARRVLVAKAWQFSRATKQQIIVLIQ